MGRDLPIAFLITPVRGVGMANIHPKEKARNFL